MDRSSPIRKDSSRRASASFRAVLCATLCLTLGVEFTRGQVDPLPPNGTGRAPMPATPGMAVPSTGASPTSPGMTPPLIKESPLETVYLRDEEGNLVPTIKAFTFEELEEFLRLKQQMVQPDAPRPFSLQSLDLDVRIDPDRAVATAVVGVKLNRTGWTGVPLRFDRMLLEARPTWKTAREVDLEYKEGEGWLAWIDGDENAVVEISLSFISTERDAFDERSWRASLPTAAVSKTRFSIDGGPWEGVEAPRAILPAKPVFADGRTTWTALGLVGDATVLWSKRLDADDPTATFEAQETARVTVDSTTQATCESSFLIQSLEGPARTVYLLLPERASLLPSTTATSSIALASPEETERTLPAETVGTLLRVDAPVTAVSSFRFTIAYRVAASQSGRFALERPRLMRAVRQSGTVEVVGTDAWNLDWTPRGSLQRLDRSSDDADETSNAAALFQYAQAPAPLEIDVASRTSQLIVDPVVRFDVGRRETLLDLRLTCRFQGVGELAVHLPGWTVLEVGPATLADLERLDPRQVDPLRVPFVVDASKNRGEAELRISAIRRRPEGEKRLELPIPRIDDAAVNAALVAVQSADDVELTEIAGETRGLTPDVWSAETPLEERQQAPIVYRDYGDVSDSRIVLSAERRDREISIDERAELTVRADGASLEQRFAIQSSYGALDQFDLWIPAERLLADRPLTATVNGTIVEPRLIPDIDVAMEAPLVVPDGMKRFRIDVTPPRSGLTTVTLAWEVAEQATADGAEERVRLARAILPPDAERSVQPAIAIAVAPARLRLDAERWQSTGSPEGNDSTERFVAGDAAGLQEIAFERTLRAASSEAVSRVERSWLHTEALGARLHHRYAARIRDVGAALRIEMPASAVPASASPASTVVAWNGVEIDFRSEPDGALVADLASASMASIVDGESIAAPATSGTLEIWYEEPRTSGWGGFSTTTPRPSTIDQAAPFYWSVRFPPEESILASPASMRSESVWRWNGWRFDRGPALSAADLEAWSGATAQPVVAAEEDAYVFSAAEPPSVVGVTSVPRNWAFLAYGASAFLAGLAWIYVPAIRRPWAVLAAASMLLGLALWAPERALPAAEVAACGLVVVGIAAAVDWWLHGRSGGMNAVRAVSTPRRGVSEHGQPVDEKRETSTESLQAERAEIGA